MGHVIPFSSRRSRAHRRADPAPDEVGTVLLFTGIRYERGDAPRPARRGPPRRPARPAKQV